MLTMGHRLSAPSNISFFTSTFLMERRHEDNPVYPVKHRTLLWDPIPLTEGSFSRSLIIRRLSILVPKLSLSCSRTDRIPPHSCICCADALCPVSLQMPAYMPVEPFEAFPLEFVRRKRMWLSIACGIGQ